MRVFRAARAALMHSLRVPAHATKREIRRDGAIAAACGFGVVLMGTFIPMALEEMGAPASIMRAPIVVIFVGWGLLVIGGYRALTGRHPDREDYSAASSLGRIFMMVGVIVGASVAFIGLMFVVGEVLGRN